ncbi:MAG: flagellar motor switch phosphatase FliY [Spirochaetaceae bacterium]|nr:flagellar motor switch phosphatase FliY [Spirochaetaceae bacterium]
MSDGSLSQDEIDALLMGDAPSETPASPAGGGAVLSEAEKNALLGLLGEITGSQSATLSGIMVKSVTVGAPRIDAVGREQFLSELPDEVVEIKIDYKSGMTGPHMYVLRGDDALKIAAPMIGQDDLELDGTTISAVSEAMSQITGASVTTIGDKVGETILTESPEGQSVPKAMLGLPGDKFVQITYDLQIEGQGSLKLYELFDLNIIRTIASKLGVSPAAAGPNQSMNTGMGNMGGGGMGQAQVQSQMNQSMGGFQQMPPGMGAPMMGGYGGQPAPNVQGIQLPELSPTISAGEQRNIGLLMDVSMELTVELGRTKWKIKDILGMGEGTIIELDKLAGEPVDILVNNNLIARGEVVVIDENFGVRVTEIVSTIDRMSER